MMSRELLILRHAESGWEAASDFERTLTPQGGRDAARIGEWIRTQQLQPDTILASPAQRVKETVLAVCGVLEIDPQQIHWEPAIYEASVEALAALLQRLPQQAQRILLVGHNPGVAELIGWLCSDPPAGFTPASLAWLALDGVESRAARLQQLVRPSAL
jgi:phosphohistidine phosphatase